jgi:AcrR family transcriptional regulator
VSVFVATSNHRVPQQERSRRSLEAIYAAAIDALADGGWDAVTVGEIERRSGVTRGTFYLRFETREALLDYVHGRMLREVRELQDQVFAPLVDGGPLSVREACGLAVRGMAEVFGSVGRVMVHGERAGVPASGVESVAELGRDVAAVLRRGLGADPRIGGAIEFATELAFSAFAARQRPVPAFHGHAAVSDGEFVERLTTALAAYLDAGLPSPRSS